MCCSIFREPKWDLSAEISPILEKLTNFRIMAVLVLWEKEIKSKIYTNL